MNGVLGLSPLALVSAITNSSGTLYVSLAQEFGDKNDVAAIGPLCINDLPFVTMVVFGAAGLAEIPHHEPHRLALPADTRHHPRQHRREHPQVPGPRAAT